MTGGHWCILRTSGGKTLALADSLHKAGFDVWTPRELRERLKPGTRHAPVKIKREIAVLPKLVFVRECHLIELLDIRRRAQNPHPHFSFFLFGAGVARVRDGEMQRLRKAHEKAERIMRREKRRSLVMGQRVRFSRGIIAGMDGQIVKILRNGKAAMVQFGLGFEMEIEACDFPDNLVGNDSTNLDAVA